MNLPGNSGRPVTEEYIEKFGVEAYAEFERAKFIEVFGMEKYMEAYGPLRGSRAAGNLGTMP